MSLKRNIDIVILHWIYAFDESVGQLISVRLKLSCFFFLENIVLVLSRLIIFVYICL